MAKSTAYSLAEKRSTFQRFTVFIVMAKSTAYSLAEKKIDVSEVYCLHRHGEEYGV
jgi:hypothetical protein